MVSCNDRPTARGRFDKNLGKSLAIIGGKNHDVRRRYQCVHVGPMTKHIDEPLCTNCVDISTRQRSRILWVDFASEHELSCYSLRPKSACNFDKLNYTFALDETGSKEDFGCPIGLWDVGVFSQIDSRPRNQERS